MASKRRFEYRTRLLVLEGSAEDDEITKSNAAIQGALNDHEMHDGGFELDDIVSLSRGSKFVNFIVVLVVFSRAVRE